MMMHPLHHPLHSNSSSTAQLSNDYAHTREGRPRSTTKAQRYNTFGSARQWSSRGADALVHPIHTYAPCALANTYLQACVGCESTAEELRKSLMKYLSCSHTCRQKHGPTSAASAFPAIACAVARRCHARHGSRQERGHRHGQ
jgi:hypothetical protein